MVENVASQMAEDQQLHILNKLYAFDRDPKNALLLEIEQLVDDEKRYDFEELREKVLSDCSLSVFDILEQSDTLVNPEKKHCLENLKFIFDDQNSMDEKLQRLVNL